VFVKQAMAEIRSGAIVCGELQPIGTDTGGWSLATKAEIAALEAGSATVGGWALVAASG
jgi:hypothetical protein